MKKKKRIWKSLVVLIAAICIFGIGYISGLSKETVADVNITDDADDTETKEYDTAVNEHTDALRKDDGTEHSDSTSKEDSDMQFTSNNEPPVSEQVVSEVAPVSDASANTTIAVINLDEGVLKNGVMTSYSSVLASYLEADVVYTGLEEGRQGVEAGRYGAYVIIPATFSENIETISTKPVKATITYSISPLLMGSAREEVILQIQSIYDSLEANISQVYLSSIMKDYHSVQDEASRIMARDLADKEVLWSISGDDLLTLIEIPELKSVSKEIDYLNLAERFMENSKAVSGIDRTYQDSFQRGAEAYSSAVNASKQVEGSTGAANESYGKVTNGLNGLASDYQDTRDGYSEIDYDGIKHSITGASDETKKDGLLSTYNKSLGTVNGKISSSLTEYGNIERWNQELLSELSDISGDAGQELPTDVEGGYAKQFQLYTTNQYNDLSVTMKSLIMEQTFDLSYLTYRNTYLEERMAATDERKAYLDGYIYELSVILEAQARRIDELYVGIDVRDQKISELEYAINFANQRNADWNGDGIPDRYQDLDEDGVMDGDAYEDIWLSAVIPPELGEHTHADIPMYELEIPYHEFDESLVPIPDEAAVNAGIEESILSSGIDTESKQITVKGYKDTVDVPELAESIDIEATAKQLDSLIHASKNGISERDSDLHTVYTDIYAVYSDINGLRTELDGFSAMYREQNTQVEGFKNSVLEYSVLDYIADEEVRNHMAAITAADEKLTNDIDLHTKQYDEYTEKVYASTDENLTLLKDRIKTGQEAADERLAAALAEAKRSRDESSQANVDALSTFSNRLAYTRVGELENREVYSFIAKPFVLVNAETNAAGAAGGASSTGGSQSGTGATSSSSSGSSSSGGSYSPSENTAGRITEAQPENTPKAVVGIVEKIKEYPSWLIPLLIVLNLISLIIGFIAARLRYKRQRVKNL